VANRGMECCCDGSRVAAGWHKGVAFTTLEYVPLMHRGVLQSANLVASAHDTLSGQ